MLTGAWQGMLWVTWDSGRWHPSPSPSHIPILPPTSDTHPFMGSQPFIWLPMKSHKRQPNPSGQSGEIACGDSCSVKWEWSMFPVRIPGNCVHKAPGTGRLSRRVVIIVSVAQPHSPSLLFIHPSTYPFIHSFNRLSFIPGAGTVEETEP